MNAFSKRLTGYNLDGGGGGGGEGRSDAVRIRFVLPCVCTLITDSFSFLRKFTYVCPLFANIVCKTLSTSHSGWTLN